MSGNSITVGKLAKQVGGISLDSLIKQLKLAGVKVDNENDEITENDKQKLLQLLNQKKGEMSLTRRVTTKIQVTAASGKNSTVNVINRRKIYMPSAHKIEEPKVQEEEKAAAESEDNKLAKEVFVAEPVMAVDSTVSEDAVSGKVDDNNQKPSKSKGNAGVSTKKPHSAVKEKEKDSDKRKNKSRPQNEVDFKRSHKKAKDYLQDDINAEVRSRRGKFKHKTTDVNPHAFAKPDQPITYEVTIVESSTVAELAKSMSVKAVEVIKVLMNMGVMATINQILDTDTAILVVEEMGHKAVVAKTNMLEESLAIEHQGELMPRCPVVTVMGHVDHGKTSLLDAIRNTNVTVQESGGITQHIGAYQVETSKGRVTFLDTPGHSAFTAMRARGANCTDIIVLVVAADDGVMPQTIEAIQHAKAAKVPIIVAVNKIDKPESDVERILGELSNYELMPESWGGDTQFVHVSAKEGTGIEDLLDAIVLQAEVMELSAINTGPAQGVVLESRIDKGRGTVTSVLVQSGQLLAGDMVLAGLEYGRVKVINDENGLVKQSAGPSTPIEILGISGIPQAGDVFQVVSNERKAREVALQRQSKSRELKLSRQNASKLQGFMEHIKQGESKSLNIVLKADVQGSIEALSDSLEKLSNDEVKVKVVGKGVGGFNESDVHLCIASEGILIGFNVRADASAKKIARQEGIEVNYFSVIYDAIDSVKQAVLGKLGPKYAERILGLAQVREVYRSAKFGAIAGCMVIEGVVKRNNPIRVLRNNVVIYEGELESLRRFKDNVHEVRNNMECGIGVKNYNDVKAGDQIEVYETIEVPRILE